jgi:AraC-like DNA-binding protein
MVSRVVDLDIALRGGAFALLLLLAAVLLRDAVRTVSGRLGVAFTIGTAAYVVCSAGGFAPRAHYWHLPILALCVGNPVVFWLFARSLFEDGFRPRLIHLGGWAAWVALGLVCVGLLEGTAWLAVGLVLQLGTLLFAILALAVAIRGRGADLVEPRRRLRLVFVGATALYSLGIAVSELMLRGGPAPPALQTLNAAGLLAMTLAFAVALTGLRDASLFLPIAPVAAPDAPPPVPIDEAEQRLLQSLRQAMDVERAYREEGLTIARLAERLGVPEYRLRRLINQRLGYRNFNAYLNGLRLAEVKTALADPGQAEVPIITIALDAGFQSLGPFNRAFKAETGLTPTEFRRAAAGNRPPELADSEIGEAIQRSGER